MTWLFRWLSCEDYTKGDNRNFTFFNAAHGRVTIPFDYTATGVVVRRQKHDEEMKSSDQLIFEQYVATITDYPCDVELFTKMSLTNLHIDAPMLPLRLPMILSCARPSMCATMDVSLWCSALNVTGLSTPRLSVMQRHECLTHPFCRERMAGVVHYPSSTTLAS